VKRDEVERRLLEVHARLVRARKSWRSPKSSSTFSSRPRTRPYSALVSETPLADRDWQDAQRHAEVMIRGRDSAGARVAELERAQDELLAKLVV